MKKSLVLGLISFIAISAQAILTPITDSIPMADGKMLAVDIYIPSGMTTGPVILIQTPYNRQISRVVGLPLGIGLNVNSSNYIFVITDWRGFYGSRNSAYFGSPDRTSDGYETVEWIANQTWSNDKIGTWGPSALGKVQFQTAKRNPPHLTCICPLVAAPQFEYNEYFPNGALRTEYVEQLDQLGFGLTTLLMAHPYKDNTWTFTEAANNYPDSIKIPCFMIGGWYDHNTQLMMTYFEQLRQKSFFSVRSKHKILMGPWVHGGHGSARVGDNLQGELSYPNAVSKNDSMALQFFDFYLRNVNNNWESNSVYTYYQMGENKWEQTSVWPPSGVQPVKFYLNSSNKLSNILPSSNSDSFSFVYNPSDPSPTIGGPTLRNDLDQGPYNQLNGVENRSDNIVFTTEILPKDFVLKGNIIVHLKVSSDRIDSDFDVRICDVYPDGKSMLVNDGVMRMRFRNGFTQAQVAMMVPGQIYDCIITLPATAITFLSGHKIRIIISSSNYPRFNRNMNTGANMYPGNSTDSLWNPLVANNTVHVSSINSSYIELPLLNFSNSITSTNKENSIFSVYPNPSSNLLFIQIDTNINSNTEISILNQLGQEVMTQSVFSKLTEIDISGLSPGVYTISISNRDGNFSKQLIKL